MARACACLGVRLSPSLHAVYNNKCYIDIVQHAAEQSMAAAIEEVKAMAHYDTDGEARNTYCMQPHVHVSVYVYVYVPLLVGHH